MTVWNIDDYFPFPSVGAPIPGNGLTKLPVNGVDYQALEGLHLEIFGMAEGCQKGFTPH